MGRIAKFAQSAKAGAGETIAVYKYLQRQRPRRGRGVIHSLGAVKICWQAAGWGSRDGLSGPDGGSGPARRAPHMEPSLSPGHEARAAEGLKGSKLRVPTAARRAIAGVQTRTMVNCTEKIRAEELPSQSTENCAARHPFHG